MTDEPKYRIHWIAWATRATGHGTGVFEYNEAVEIANALNEKDRDNAIFHWPKLVRTNTDEATE